MAFTTGDTMELQSRNRSLESHVIRKAVTRGSEGGGWKSVHTLRVQGNSLAAYPTSRTVLRGRGASNGPLLPDLYLTHPQINSSRQRDHIGTISPTGTYALRQLGMRHELRLSPCPQN
jgi:hypothetical protein